jgi:hypothetical protein
MLRRKRPVSAPAETWNNKYSPKDHAKAIDFALIVTRLLQAYMLCQTLYYLSELVFKCSRRTPVDQFLLNNFVIGYNATIQPRKKQGRYSFAKAYKRKKPPFDEYTGPQRTFPIYPHSFPCADWEGAHSRSPTAEGFLYMKEMKTGSSTLAGVTLRIARNMAKRLQKFNATDFPMCRARFFHMRARKFQNRLRQKSFLWSILREPNARMLSKFFHFAVSRTNVVPTATELSAYYHTYDIWIYDQAYYLKSLAVQEVKPRNPETYVNATQTVLDDYDFIGITERLDESLVVLQLLLGLETQDILYLSSKSSESFEYLPSAQGCLYLTPKFETPAMREFFQSPLWTKYTQADQLLYRAANKSLDLTIEALGRDLVDKQLRKFKWAQELAYKTCIDRVVFPCTADGKEQLDTSDCLYQDAGCGYACLDKVGEALSSMSEFRDIL